jgi:hypothetical protein
MTYEQVYEMYVAWCEKIGVKPAAFEVWCIYAR